MSIQKIMRIKKIESNFDFAFVGQRFNNTTSDTTMQTQTQTQIQTPTLDILQQFDVLLKNHSIVVSDRENLAKLFVTIMDLCTQMPKTKLKAALKAATQEPKTTPKPRAKAQSKLKTQTQPKEIIADPTDAGDAPMMSDLAEVKVVARGRGRPRKAATDMAPLATAAAAANANPNAESAEKKRRGRPKKDKSVTISSNDDEDALIEKMMADVASMQKDKGLIACPTSAIADPATDDDETDDEVYSPIQVFTGALMRCEEMTPIAATTESLSPVIHASSSSSFQQFNFEIEVEVEAPKAVNATKTPKTKAAKEPKAKAVKAKELNAKEPKTIKAKEPKPIKAKEPKTIKAKELNAKETNETVAQIAIEVAAIALPAPLASFSADSHLENKETNGKIYMLAMIPTTSFSYNGRTYKRTETDNVYDNLTHELIGVWDHSNHEIITAFDEEDDDLNFSDEE